MTSMATTFSYRQTNRFIGWQKKLSFQTAKQSIPFKLTILLLISTKKGLDIERPFRGNKIIFRNHKKRNYQNGFQNELNFWQL